MTVSTIIKQALRLPVPGRLGIATLLLNSVTTRFPATEEETLVEAARRFEDVDQGRARLLTEDEFWRAFP